MLRANALPSPQLSERVAHSPLLGFDVVRLTVNLEDIAARC